MSQVLCLWLPNWSIQQRRHSSPALREIPLVLFRNTQGRELVSARCSMAGQRGVQVGMPLVEAQALLQSSHRHHHSGRCLPDEPQFDLTALRQLAWDCEEFSPLVGIEAASSPESLMLEITGCATHFGGEQGLSEKLLECMQAKGLEARIGLAETFGAAWAISHCRPRLQVIQTMASGDQERVLRSLPITALRLSSGVVDRLQQVGIQTIGQLLALPRTTLPARFGPELLQRLDQALGRQPELIVAERRPESIKETWESEFPLSERESLEKIVTQLLEKLLLVLKPRQQGIKQLVWTLQQANGERVTQTIDLLQPSCEETYLQMLMELQWERLSLLSGVQRVSLTAKEVAPLIRRKQALWNIETDANLPAVNQLIETLSTRLGAEAVLRPYLRADDQPELAFGCESAISTESRSDSLRLAASHTHRELTRPFWLKRDPIPVEVLSIHRTGPPVQLRWQQQDHLVHQCWGPERITTAWWRGELIRRDYFQVEVEDGRRFWLFQELVTKKWFCHAILS